MTRKPTPMLRKSLEPLQVEPLAVAAPGTRQVFFHLARFTRHALLVESLLEAVKRPRIVRRLPQAFAKRLARSLRIALQEEHRPERLAHRVVPVRRFHVRERILDRSGGTEL